MAQYGWENCPIAVRAQVDSLIDALVQLPETELVGVYLHGSLAMRCFNPQRSDLDILAITADRLSLAAKRTLAEAILKLSGAPQAIEISTLAQADLLPWRYPTPFDFHYSETWREQTQAALGSGEWQRWNDTIATDPDLAAHITIIRVRGMCVYGAAIDAIFPVVPVEDYRDSIVKDIRGALDSVQDDPVYAVLNTCRVYAFLRAGLICSKQEGGTWALGIVPHGIRPTIALALDAYADEHRDRLFDPASLAAFTEYMRQQLQSYAVTV